MFNVWQAAAMSLSAFAVGFSLANLLWTVKGRRR